MLIKKLSIACLLVLTLNACEWHQRLQEDFRQGQWLREQQINQLSHGMSRNDVAHLLGSPVKQSFDEHEWTYMEYHKKRGKVLVHRYVNLFFNSSGRLHKIQHSKTIKPKS